jgi:hypothetical protein
MAGSNGPVAGGLCPQMLDEAGVPVDYRSSERMGHSLHGQDPRLFTDTLVDWAAGLGA